MRHLLYFAALVLALAAPANAHGVATHAWIAEQSASRLAATDPSLAFLATDADARACFMYGAIFPDMISASHEVGSFDTIKGRILASGFVSSVEFSTAGVSTTFQGWHTHTSGLVLALVQHAKTTGDRYKLAFALGNLAHASQDKHAEEFMSLCQIQRRECGDLGVGAVAQPSSAPSWYAGTENELFFEATADLARPDSIIEFVQSAPWRLASNATVSYNRALALRSFYREAVAAHLTAAGVAPPSESQIQNAAKIFEVSLTFYRFFTGREPLGDAIRLVMERYVRLHLWASVLNGIVQSIATSLLGGQDVFDVVGPLVVPVATGQLGGAKPGVDIVFAYGQGAADIAKIRQKYAGNDEFARLEASGLLDPAFYAGLDYDLGVHFTVDACSRQAASKLMTDGRWHYSTKANKAAAMRSLLRATGRDGVANAPDVLVWDARFIDVATGARLTQIRLPQDVGRTIRAEVEVYGTARDPIARILRLRMRGDVAGTASILAGRTALVPAEGFDPYRYGHIERPRLEIEWVVADVPGLGAIDLVLDEHRVGALPDEAAVDTLFDTDVRALAGLIAGRPHYDLHYTRFTPNLGALEVTR